MAIIRSFQIGFFVWVLINSQSLIAKGENDCEFHRNNLEAPHPISDAAKIRWARCLVESKTPHLAVEVYKEVLNGPFGKDLDVMEEAAIFFLRAGEFAFTAELADRLPLTDSLLFRGAKKREKGAAVLLRLSEGLKERKYQDLQDKILLRLYRDLPETRAANFSQKRGYFVKLQKMHSVDLDLPRARQLTNSNRNQAVIETLKSHADCEARYLSGKAFRKMRNYRAANDILKEVADQCANNPQRDALFMMSRLAVMEPEPQSFVTFDRFLDLHPNHSFSDDVMMWKARAFESLGDFDKADETLTELIERYPDGDKIDDARFRRVLMRLNKNDGAGAIALLREMPKRGLPDDTREQMRYWLGRLLLFPSVQELTPNPNKVQIKEGLEILRKLGDQEPASYYGYLASSAVNRLSGSKTPSRFPRIGAEISCTEIWLHAAKRNEVFSDAHTLAQKKYEPEAVMLLDNFLVQKIPSRDEALYLAAAYLCLDRPDKSYQIMRAAAFADPSGVPDHKTKLQWNLAYPLAYNSDVRRATAHAKIPSTLLWALMREESAFDADAVSSAGALGLCQVMPEVGQKEAAFLGFFSLHPDSFLTPGENTMLGAQKLAGYLKRFKHPFLAIAAYNGGEDNVSRWLKASIPNRPIDIFVENIPFEETRKYVKRVAQSWVIYGLLANQLKEVGLQT